MVKKTAKSGSGSHHQQGSVLPVGRNCYHLPCRNDFVVAQRKFNYIILCAPKAFAQTVTLTEINAQMENQDLKILK